MGTSPLTDEVQDFGGEDGLRKEGMLRGLWIMDSLMLFLQKPSLCFSIVAFLYLLFCNNVSCNVDVAMLLVVIFLGQSPTQATYYSIQ
jgi:hypothetical protein